MPVINGTSGRDTLNGSSDADVISGGEGGDTLNGGAGADILYGFGVSDTTPGSSMISATLIESGLSRPVFAASPPGDPDQLFIIEQHTGMIKILDLQTGNVNPTPFLDINGIATGGEQGLLGLAFHPNYATNGLYYIYLTNTSGDIEIWQYTRGANPDVSDTTRQLVLAFDHPAETNHNGGWMAFGPDGYLYIATGDGGGGGDPNNFAQNVNSLLGKILRIDVNGDDFPGNANANYAIPADNPYVGVNGADEVFAIGLRNPWRNSFDTLTGDLVIADVGQSALEEVNFIPAGTLSGRNFGWAVMEGTNVFDDDRPGNPPPGSPLLTAPIHVYGHGSGENQGFSITGGYVIRGPDAGAQGLYIFADFVSGNIWTMRAGDGFAEDVVRRNLQIQANAGSVNQIASFAIDGSARVYAIGLDGEIHLLTFSAGAGDGSDILNGGAGADQLYGGVADDQLNGGDDGDLLNGELGNDVLNGDAGADTLDGGGGVDQLFGGDGDDTVFWDAGDDLANVQGDGGSDMLVFTSGTAPTSFNLADHGFEQAEGRLTDTAGEPWATRTLRYTGLWQLDVETTIYDDGSKAISDYDQAGAFVWTSEWTRYDTLNRVDVVVTTFDDGSRSINDLDETGAQSWSSYWTRYDSADLVDVVVTTNDDGSYSINDFDQAGAQSWATQWTGYDSLGRVDVVVTTNDDGSYSINDFDQAGTQSWATQWTGYDSLARVDAVVTTNDDGTHSILDLDQANAFAWQSMWWLYDAGGNVVAFQGVNDDGSMF